jgi:outer membrane protein OmpA-like peptidoglycan-associated protein
LGHLVFLRRAEKWVVPGFSSESYDTVVPRTFRMKRVEISQKILEEPKPEMERKERERPILPEMEKPLAGDPTTPNGGEALLRKPEEMLPREMPGTDGREKDMKSLISGMEEKADRDPSLEVPSGKAYPLSIPEREHVEGKEESGGGLGETSTPGFSSLDDLLAGGGNVTGSTAPILMPTDLLFEYDSDSLKPEAAQTLEKLAELIRKNSQASFRIEGHTDSFGSDEYNIGLSLRRATAVKTWLEKSFGMDGTKIKTTGFGKSHPLVSPTGSVDDQQLNRRVEIVINATQP